ncbi:hypothetical protein HU200_027065 [Digitaria exilis]|uniref:No apical meristem-associated C-terminal domain-containing protein n=1 Tax=Digitaria exilis TaxID=1010633 RepID=A0A835BUT0_9POAL|nr:hypothetical protein HU200_027065 [Digitaria exilis]
MKNLVVIQNDEHTLRKERWTKDLSLEQRRLEIEERKLQWEQEKQIMFCDVNALDDDQRTYVLAKRAQFAKMASISSSGGGSVGETSDAADFSSV